MNIGLVLTGGGARGAWQAGALRAVGEMVGGPLPVNVVAGTSAGAINATWVAAHALERGSGGDGLAALWSSLRADSVFRTDPGTFLRIGADWMTDLGLGGLVGAGRSKALLDTTPLQQLLSRRLDMAAVVRNIESGWIRGLAVSATSYDRGIGVTFFDGAANIPPWDRRTRLGSRSRLGTEHVLASAAIPIFFPAIQVDGEWFGDGCIRMDTPLSPAIHLGADRILAMGLRSTPPARPVVPRDYPSKARIAGLLLDALFLDSLEADVERADRTNRMIELLSPETASRAGLRPVPVLLLLPSQDLGSVGRKALGQFPAILRHLLAGLGADEQEGWDLVSYLAFEPAYLEPILELGYRDALARRDEILRFFGG